MATKRTITDLVKHRAELVAELSLVREEIASRAGEVDPPKPAAKHGK